MCKENLNQGREVVESKTAMLVLEQVEKPQKQLEDHGSNVLLKRVHTEFDLQWTVLKGQIQISEAFWGTFILHFQTRPIDLEH